MVISLHKTKLLAAMIAAGFVVAGCSSSGGDTATTAVEGTAAYVTANAELKGDFNEDVILVTGTDYMITGEVNFLDGTTLTIPAGTILYGSTASSYLAINAGAMIDAQGTAADPIIFTSSSEYNNLSAIGTQGEWGGVTIIGNAPIHGGTKTYEAGTQVGGGTDAADNSGTLNYVMIKNSGFEVETDKELNGLSLLAVGSGTSITNIAVLGGADDGIELWGGTVDLTNVYVYNAGDDSIDTDSGYTGTIDNAVVIQKIVDKTNYDSSGIESGNDSDTYDVSPTGTESPTKPVLKNATIETVGGAIYIKNDSGYYFDNVVVTVKASTEDTQVDTVGQAVVTHRTTDTVDDLSSVPYGIEFGANGLVLNNTVTPEAVFATTTAKDVASGGSSDATHIEAYWLANADVTAASYTGPLFVSAATLNDGTTAVDVGAAVNSVDGAAVTGADQSVFAWVLNELNSLPTQVVSADITGNTTWSKGINYALQGEINVISPAVLTIEAGVTVYGLTSSSYLAVNNGAQIMAVGTQAEPITFTSAADVAGTNSGDTFQGQWGGLTLIGDAPIVGGTKTYEAGTQVGGGSNAADNSGTLEYVVIKNTGFEVEADKELNGLSLLAVGSGTTIQNVAVLSSADDGIELWGGTVDLTGVYVYNAGDDSLDTDLGYTGTITDAYIQQYIVDRTNYDSSGLENGNDSDSYTSLGGTSNAIDEQSTMPTYVNVTVEAVGGAIYLKNDAGGIFDNVSVISNDPDVATSQTATAGQAIITHRTTDTVDDLSGSPYGVQILTGGLELINNVVATDIYADTTAKGSAAGGCDPADAGTDGAPNCTDHIMDYWVTNNPGTTPFETDDGAITGATISNIWKGNAGSND